MPSSNRAVDDEIGVKIEIREWELNESSTAFEHLLATPSDDTMRIQWRMFITILSAAIVLMIFVFVGMLSDKKCRRNSFNTYILFLMGPDIVFTACCIVSCSLSLHRSRFHGVGGCVFQSLYAMFAITSSAWINAVVVFQLHKMLRCSRNAIRYHPPSRAGVIKQCLLVYAYSLFVATWSNLGLDWLPLYNNVYAGVLCLPMPYDTGSTLFFYLFYAPMVFFIPLAYICYVVFDMVRNNLLPERKQRKTLMVFLRLLLVYFIMWVPALGFVFIAGNWLTTWYGAFGAAWSHLQGAASAAICLAKPDIQEACRNLLPSFCCCSNDIGDDSERQRSASRETSSTLRRFPRRMSQDFLGMQAETAKTDDFCGHDDGNADNHNEDIEMNPMDEGNVCEWKKEEDGGNPSLNPCAFELAMGLEAGELRNVPSQDGDEV